MSESTISAAVLGARARLARVAGAKMALRRAAVIVGAGASAAALRPLLWPRGPEGSPWAGALRATTLLGAGCVAAAAVLIVWGRRRGPTALGAARAIDERLRLDEVVASGFAFEATAARGLASTPVAAGLRELARLRAAAAVAGLDVASAFPMPRVTVSRRRVAAAAGVLALALLVGTYDPSLGRLVLSPPTASEVAAAGQLDAAASAPPRAREASQTPAEKRGAELARDAVGATKRGDWRQAMDDLDALRSEAHRQARAAALADAATATMREALGGDAREAMHGSDRAAASSAADALRAMAEELRADEAAGRATADTAAMVDRLARAAEGAQAMAREEGDDGERAERAFAEGAARAMREAADALARGDRDAARRALQEAATRTGEMERQRAARDATAGALSEMLDKSDALRGALSSRDAAARALSEMLGKSNAPGGAPSNAANGPSRPGPGGSPAPGGGRSDDPDATHREGLTPSGDISAHSQVTEGEKAIVAIQGLGKGTPPDAYRQVFPSYDTAVEEGLQDDRIPASRKTVVRRYFQAIRPE